MASEKRLIDANAFKIYLEKIRQEMLEENTMSSDFAAEVVETVQDEYLQKAPTVDAIPVEELEQLLAVAPGLELWDYQKRAIMNAVHRMLGKERQ